MNVAKKEIPADLIALIEEKHIPYQQVSKGYIKLFGNYRSIYEAIGIFFKKSQDKYWHSINETKTPNVIGIEIG